MRSFACFLSLSLLVATVAPSIAHAIRIDIFEGQQSVQATVGAPGVSTVAQANAIGGFRTITSVVSAGASGSKDEVGNTVFEHSQGFGVSGQSALIWDGDAIGTNLNPAGLGSINFLQDGATAIALSGLSFDKPQQSNLTLKLFLYDATDATGQKWSSASVLLDRSMSEETVLLPFSSFTVSGPSGAASISNIGAIMLVIDGSEPNVDMQLKKIGTNGRCDLIPNQGVVVDQCGVCGGDNSSCADCQGKPNGPALPGTACDSGANGECRGGIYTPSCVCQSQTAPTTERCDALDNDCDGLVDEITDSCGVCGGDNTSCLECKKLDLGDISTRLDGGAKSQERVIRNYIYAAKFALPNKQVRAYLRDVKKRAHALQIRNWILSWTLPRTSITCIEAAICIRQSNLPVLDEYRTHAEQLLKLFYEVQQSHFKIQGPGPNKERRLQARAEALYKANIELAGTVPEFQSVCGGAPA
jgi:hypothetical protein